MAINISNLAKNDCFKFVTILLYTCFMYFCDIPPVSCNLCEAKYFFSLFYPYAQKNATK